MKNPVLDTQPNVLRRKLLLGLPSGLALSTPFALVSCGGGGDDAAPAAGDAPNAPTMTAQALPLRVTLPAGAPQALKTMFVASGASLARVADDGSTGILSLDDGASMAYLMTDAGALLGLGFVGTDRPAIDARSTAEALIYFCCLPSQLGEEWQFALRQVLITHALVTPVVVAVEAAIRNGGLAANDSALIDALLNAVALIRRSAPAPLAAPRARALSLRYNFDAHSGMRAIAQDGFNTICLENSFRRRAHAVVERVGYLTAEGNKVDIAPVKVGEFAVDPADALNLSNVLIFGFEKTVGALLAKIGLIGDYMSGTAPWTPKLSSAIVLPLEPQNAAESLYKVTVVGPGRLPGERALTASEQETLTQLQITTALKDILIPLASAFLMPVVGKAGGDALKNKAAALVAFSMGLDATKGALNMSFFQGTLNAVKAGNWKEALLAAGTEMFGTDTGQKLLLDALGNIARSVGSAQLTASLRDSAGNLLGVNLLSTAGDQMANTLAGGMGRINGIFAAFEAAFAIADVSAQANDYANAKELDTFDIDGLVANIEITPATITLLPTGDEQRFQISAVDGQAPQSNYLYEWSCPSLRGILTVGGQSTSASHTTLLEAPSPSALYVVAGGNKGGETEEVSVKVFTATRQYMGRAKAKVTIDNPVQATLTPPKVEFERDTTGSQQVFALTLDPAPLDTTQLSYDWICPSQHGALQSGGVTTSIDQPRVTSGQPNATYRLDSGKTGGERENLTVEVFQRSVDASTGAESRRKIASAQAVAQVKSEFNLGISPPGPSEVPADTAFPVTGFLKETLPAGSTVDWQWSLAGVGSLDATTLQTSTGSTPINFNTASTEGASTITVTATVHIPASGSSPARTVLTAPANAAFNVKKGLRQVVMEVSGGVFGCSDPKACGVTEYTAFVVPRLPKAVLYSAVLSGYAYAGCNRTVTWNSVVGDGGGCNFPVTYFPHSSAGATNFWAVWIGFGGAFSGKCVVTITLTN